MEYEIGEGESVSTVVVRAVSAVEDRDPRSMQPLAHVVDPSALDALFDARLDGTPRPGGQLSFVYSDCRICVDNGEYLSVEPIGFAPKRDRSNGDLE